MLTVVDSILLFLAVLFLRNGWRRGLMRTLIGPASLLLCSIIGIIYLDLTGNIMKSFLMATFGTLILSVTIKVALMIGRRTVAKEHRNYVFIGSRILGSFFSLFWKGGIALILLLLLTFFPEDIPHLQDIQKNINRSIAYSLMNQYIVSKVPPLKKTFNALSIFKDPRRMQQLSSSEDFQEFLHEEKIQAIASDEEIAEHIKNKNIAGLIANPKIRALMQDEQLMEKMFDLGQKIFLNQTGEQTDHTLYNRMYSGPYSEPQNE